MKAYWRSGFLTSALDGGEWSASRPGHFTLRDRRLGGHQNRSGLGGGEKNSQYLSGLDPPIIQPVAQRYTTEKSRLLSTRNIFLTQHHTMKA
jgi:hypothetical protein